MMFISRVINYANFFLLNHTKLFLHTEWTTFSKRRFEYVILNSSIEDSKNFLFNMSM